MPRGIQKITSENTIKQLILEAYEAERQAGEYLLAADQRKEKVYEFMRERGVKHFDAYRSPELSIRIQSAERATINYDIEKLCCALPQKVLEEVIDKEYTITDFNGFKNLMVKYGVPASAVKQFISVAKSVNKTRMNDLFKSGHITTKQLKGCYTVNESLSLKLKELITQ